MQESETSQDRVNCQGSITSRNTSPANHKDSSSLEYRLANISDASTLLLNLPIMVTENPVDRLGKIYLNSKSNIKVGLRADGYFFICQVPV